MERLKIHPPLNITILDMTINKTAAFAKIVGVQVNYKIVQLKFFREAIIFHYPPILAHGLLSISSESVTSKNFRG